MKDFEYNIDIAPFTTFGVRARTQYFAAFSSVEALRALLSDVGERELLILGGGSNMLFVRDFQGVTLRNLITGIERVDEDKDSVVLNVGAGENWHEFVLFAIAQGLGGVENLSLIPGSVGASPIQNIGAYGVEIKDVFESLEAVEIATGAARTFDLDACDFGYRDSIFKRELRGKYVITSVSFRLSKAPVLNTSYGTIEQELAARQIAQPTIKNVSDAVIAIRRSKLPDPAEIGNGGSFFKNPIIPHAQFLALKKRFEEMPSYPVDEDSVKVPAGWLIDQAGWKGKTFGACGVHKRQALVLVNYGDATGAEIYALSERIIDDIFERYGIRLEREVNMIG
ncbi:UDP-N-acetylmuramate dehydrogenase [Bradymonas sediminis]|uniref:UDP-N-acetylenolpyruvoylglucosamine reductase n=1 Tax=Bradymonas sediminis TaxID=1548548 RepID=A0A2Z4FII7_9DELT|nr:UDP-N-acetylmuramate dehydrogenase [Bradymonas sediminis]AWV88729.1 UDP-N-acetylenolpyruvoylglucosamine reductase [Bradymonas sediminis]TDP63578.1 UDP-N-acetylmuramate dehydrogenase [Bradymonas sediminis]